MYFQYDNSGTPLGFVYNETQYFYVTNQMGDVLGITDANGTLLAQYAYDDWGTLLAIDTADEDGATAYREIAEANPLRYRGYYFDSETGYYYLQSRYYDPEICRFINADVPEIAKVSKEIDNGINVFAYCNNNAVNHADCTGFLKNWDAAILIVMFVAYYIAPKRLKVNSKYKFEAGRMLKDSMGNFIVKITYYKSKLFKNSFVVSIGDKGSWQKATKVNNHLNMDFIKQQGNYIQTQYNKGTSVSLTNKGPDIISINLASATIALHLISKGIKASVIKSYYNKVWGGRAYSNYGKNLYYLINITKGNSKVNGWYAYRNSNGAVSKL